MLVCWNKVPKWLLGAPCCRKEDCFRAIRIPFADSVSRSLCWQWTKCISVNFLCTCPVYSLIRCWSYLWLGSWAVTMVPVWMMGHFNNEASQGLCTPKFPKACDISLLLRTGSSLIWREGKEKSCCRTCSVSLLGFVPTLSPVLQQPSVVWCLGWAGWACCSALGCVHLWQAPGQWGFGSITWHRAVSHCVLLAKKHYTVRVHDFNGNVPFLSSGFPSLLRKYYCRYIFKTCVGRPALQGPSLAPFL